MLGAVILAGGKSERFGTNKAFALLKGKEIIQWSIEGLNEIAQEIVISVKKIDNRYRRFVSGKIKLIEDLYELEGPLVGLYSSLLSMNSKYVYIHPVDSPYILKDYIMYMLESIKGYNACAVKFEDDSFDPTHSIVDKDIALIYSKKLIEKGYTSLKSLFLTMPNVRFIKKSEIKIKEVDKVFININTKEDLEIEEHK
jgi:molybdopterin-guanine dinucleotide biosynthesis protein A